MGLFLCIGSCFYVAVMEYFKLASFNLSEKLSTSLSRIIFDSVVVRIWRNPDTKMILVLTLLLLILLQLLFFTRSSKRMVPGLSKRDKITGNLTDIAEAGGFLSFLKLLHNRFGPIASYWQGDVLTVSIANQKYFKETEKMFDRHPALFKVRRWNLLTHSYI